MKPTAKNPTALSILFLLLLTLIPATAPAADDPGAGPVYHEPEVNFSGPLANPSLDIPNGHVSHIFTVGDVIFFSYADGTLFELYDDTDTLIWDNGGLPVDKGQQATVTGISGAFKAVGSETFAVLSGDPVTNNVCGYFAMDDRGFGTSTEFFTWVPALYSHCEFVVFGYHENTQVTVSYADTGVVIDTFTLDDGEHWNNSTLSASWLHVEASHPVSALTGYDQGYFVPADDGLWSGTKFHTYVPDTGGWSADLTVIAYEDGTNVSIVNSDTMAPVWSGMLSSGEAHVESFLAGSGEYFTITSDQDVTVNCQPWFSYPSNYHNGAYIPDRTGSGVGTNFLGPSWTGGPLQVLAYQDGTNVEVLDPVTDAVMGTYMLDAGESVNGNPGNGLWRVRSDKIVSVYSGWGTFSADFAPVEFAETINPLNLNGTDGFPEGHCLMNGDVFDYTFCYDNAQNDIEVTQVVLTATLPMEVSFQSATGGGMYDMGTHTVTWDIGTLTPGDVGDCAMVSVMVEDDLDFMFIQSTATITSAETGTQSVTVTSEICESVGVEMPAPLLVTIDGGVTLNWQYTGSPVDGFNIYRRTPDGPPQKVNADLVPWNFGQVTYTDSRPAEDGATLLYSYAKVEGGQETGRSGELEVVWSGDTPSATAVLGAFPNPFNPQTTIKFNLRHDGPATLSIFDLGGRLVSVLHDGHLPAGPHQRVWTGLDATGRRAPSGVYHYRLQTTDGVFTGSMTMIK